MKRRDLERRLTALGWRFFRHGGKHDVWVHGEQIEAIPRHADINDRLAKAILERAARRN
jgi:mRNA interferase HicA